MWMVYHGSPMDVLTRPLPMVRLSTPNFSRGWQPADTQRLLVVIASTATVDPCWWFYLLVYWYTQYNPQIQNSRLLRGKSTSHGGSIAQLLSMMSVICGWTNPQQPTGTEVEKHRSQFLHVAVVHAVTGRHPMHCRPVAWIRESVIGAMLESSAGDLPLFWRTGILCSHAGWAATFSLSLDSRAQPN